MKLVSQQMAVVLQNVLLDGATAIWPKWQAIALQKRASEVGP
jgi:hypothetical protein